MEVVPGYSCASLVQPQVSKLASRSSRNSWQLSAFAAWFQADTGMTLDELGWLRHFTGVSQVFHRPRQKELLFVGQPGLHTDSDST